MKPINEMTDEDIMSNAIRFSLQRCALREGEKSGDRPDFQNTKHTFIVCAKWLRDNYMDADPNMGEFVEAKL